VLKTLQANKEKAMATIRPFKGVRYNPERIPDLSAVVSQPHDRVRHGLKDRYYDLSPYNIVRIIRGKDYPTDDVANNVYTRARDTYQTWLREGILMREQAPAFYILRQTFTLPGDGVRSRLALIAALELSHYEEGVVLPHERTLSKSMSDRLSLLRATDTNFGCIFMLYPGNGINELLKQAIEQPPALAVHEMFEHDVLQEFWAITDPDLTAAIVEEMAPRRNLIIADGHHRYETALAHRDEMREQHPDAPANAGFNYRLVSLVSMEDPGLVILPAHRLINSYGGMSTDDILSRAREYFDVLPVPNPTALEQTMAAVKGSPRPYFGFHNGTSAVLTLRDHDIMNRLLPDRIPDWRVLDTAVVHELFIERVLGIDKQHVEQKEGIDFLRDPGMGYEAVEQGKAACLLVMNPTRIEQVRTCSTAGERMPQKSTDFYPKMISGLVALPAGAEERL
jgi:uncharacterized protein (DUF1015 family)